MKRGTSIVEPDRGRSDAVSGTDDVCARLCDVLRDGEDVCRGLAAQALGRIGQSQAVDALIGSLLDEDEDVRADATQALSRLADSRACGQLLDNLIGDPCGDAKMGAIEALGRARYSPAIPWLRRLATKRDEEIAWDEEAYYDSGWDDWADIQHRAIRVLGEMGVKEAVPDIVTALGDEFGQDLTDVGFEALGRLGESGIDALAAFQDHAGDRIRRKAAAVLAGIDGPAADRAVDRALRDQSAEVRLAALRPLAARNPSDRRLALLLWDGDDGVCAEAVRLCGAENPQLLDALLDDGSEAVQSAVLSELARFPGLLPAESVAERALSRLSSRAPDLVAAAAEALAATAPQIAADALAGVLTNTERPAAARRAAIKALAAFGGDAAVQAFVAVLGDKQRQLRVEAMAALAVIAGAEENWPNPAGEALLAALRGELLAGPELDREDTDEQRRDDADEGKAAQAADATGELDDALPVGDDRSEAGLDPTERAEQEPESTFPISTLDSMVGENRPAPESKAVPDSPVELTDEDLEFLSLAGRSPPKRRVTLAPNIAPHQDIGRLAARVLGDLSHDEVASALAEALDSGDSETRNAAADSLACISARMKTLPDDAVETLLRFVTSSDTEMRICVVRALGSAGDRVTPSTMIECLSDDDELVRTEAVRALAARDASASEIADALNDPDPGVRLAAAEAITRSGGAEAVDRLVDFTFSFGGYHRRAAGRLLRHSDIGVANARFLGVLDKTERSVERQVVIEALEELNRSDAVPEEGP